MSAVLAAELTKVRTLPSAWAVVGAALVADMVLAVLARDDTLRLAGADGGTPLGQVGSLMLAPVYVFAALGAIAAGSEYTGGQLRSSLLATPDRARSFRAHLAVAAGVSAAAALVVVAPAYLVQHAGALGAGTLGPRDAVTAVLALVSAYTLVSVLAFGFAVLARGAVVPLVVLVVAALLVAPTLRGALPQVIALLPQDAALSAVGTPEGPDALTRGAGLGVLTAWVAACVAAASVTFARRDA
ncbi:hypothetical protein [Cellulomonas wangsupingiae]|uniref:ABC transporter n=1 Tax=Cellulomonas wangsupingiae TaxID=2968085 RepID=A0ABY5K5M4_9CELL|nr:hypothetical protein [Cellulomonas wangsupingiae]MCC2335065.1 hypothetical protein [Cellulomonas wangsupingiae]UUI65564.1 hypothetical protein NP075_02130 [Cellulomonas wangsupingiae]